MPSGTQVLVLQAEDYPVRHLATPATLRCPAQLFKDKLHLGRELHGLKQLPCKKGASVGASGQEGPLERMPQRLAPAVPRKAMWQWKISRGATTRTRADCSGGSARKLGLALRETLEEPRNLPGLAI